MRRYFFRFTYLICEAKFCFNWSIHPNSPERRYFESNTDAVYILYFVFLVLITLHTSTDLWRFHFSTMLFYWNVKYLTVNKFLSKCNTNFNFKK